MGEAKQDPPGDLVAALADCATEIDHLKRENDLLRDASRTFGDLAERLNERLNKTLESKSRLGHDRRAVTRGMPDRRETSGSSDASRAWAADTPQPGTPIPKVGKPRG